MFTVKAGYSNNIEIASGIERVRDFFGNVANFADLMPGVQQIHTDAKGVAHLKIQAEIPFVGAMLQSFSIRLAEQSDDRIEWTPIAAEAQNFLRYSADFFEKAKDKTLVHFSQAVELRRKSGRELHYLAGMAGEAVISNEMTKRFAEMVRVFIDRAKEKLEK